MSRRSEWHGQLERIMRNEGVRDVTISMTSGTHLRVTGTITIKGGKPATITIFASCSPGDSYAAHHRVRNDVRLAIRNANGRNP